jgi:hypothetical protein
MIENSEYYVFLNDVETLEVAEPRGKCFVACDYPKGEYAPGSQFDDFRIHLRRGMETAYTTIFADEILKPGHILHKICEQVAQTEFGIYDISNPTNPNVLIELGVAIGFNKPFILTKRANCRGIECLEGLHTFEWNSYLDLETHIMQQVQDHLLRSRNSVSERSHVCNVCGTICRSRLVERPDEAYSIIEGSSWPDFRAVVKAALADKNLAELDADKWNGLPPTTLCNYLLRVRRSRMLLFNVAEPWVPEVFLQLGMTVATCAPWFLFSREGQHVPSNLAGLQRVDFRSMAHLQQELRENIEQILFHVETSQDGFTSPNLNISQ